jgi:hypothetical protein
MFVSLDHPVGFGGGRASKARIVGFMPISFPARDWSYEIFKKIGTSMRMKYRYRQKWIFASWMLLFLLFCSQAFSQQATSLSGTVQDASIAVLPGATVTAVNTETGIKATTSTNGAGIYTFPSLQPGIYKVTAEMPGFQTQSKTEVKLGVAVNIRLNFELAVAGVTTQIEISTSAQDMLLESSSSTGTVLQEKTLTVLPNVTNDVMDLINVMGGVVKAENPIFYNNTQTFAGVPGSQVNIQRDGITINEVRYDSGIVSPARINPEMVGEFKMVLSPVDAEMGRGAGQVQMLTKSGGNAYHGSGVWNVQNTKLDANEWANNKTGTPPEWRNLNDYVISAGGPIRKNKTFFFATWDQTIARSRSNVRSFSLTPCARKGIFRYFSGWINGNTQTALSTTSGSQTRPTVDSDGTPLVPTTNQNGTPYSGTGPIAAYQGLNYYSVLGQLTAASQSQILADPINCSQYLPNGLAVGSDNGIASGTNWDPYRKAFDSSGYISRFTSLMPAANNYDIGDGLNTAAVHWVRTLTGSDTVYGSGEDNQRKSITAKIDHNFNSAHRLSGTYSYETDYGDDSYQTWPNGYGGAVDRHPQTLTANFTSTLNPTLLNEFRMGLSRTRTHTNEPLNNPNTGSQMLSLLNSLQSTAGWGKYDGFPIVIQPGVGMSGFYTDTLTSLYSCCYTSSISNPYGSRGSLPGTWGGVDPRWTYGDTITWTKGTHSFKAGAELRLASSWQETNGAAGFYFSANTFPSVQGGYTTNSPPSGLSTNSVNKWTGLVGSDYGQYSTGDVGRSYALMAYLAGSIGNIRQYYYVNSPTATSWNDATKGELMRTTDLHQREFSTFFKDDWKVSPSLTLNLGLRWEYYGIPWVAGGMTAGLKGGTSSIWGGSPHDFSQWLTAYPSFDAANLTTQAFIGPDSPNPDQQLYNRDLNNFGPAIGFAYQLPWFGKGKTTLRGGYQLNYTSIGNMTSVAGLIANVPGTVYTHTYTGDASSTYKYLDLSMLRNLVPTSQFIDSAIKPLQARPVTDRTQSLSTYDSNIRSPYTQSLTMSIARNIGSNLTVDIRYIGTLSRKQVGSINLNQANWISNGLKDAFNIVRAGGESELINKLILPGTLVTGNTTGSAQLRASSSTYTYLAVGNYNSLAGFLATTNGNVTGTSGTYGRLLRNSGTPENFIYTNPQFSAANIYGNLYHTNYHSMQAQVTLRPARGLSVQGTYTWSKNLSDLQTNTDPQNRAADYGLNAQDRRHNFTTYGSYTLPFGPNGFLFRDASKTVKKIVEGWQLSWIATATSGMPMSVTTVNSMWAGGQPDRVGEFDGHGQVTWTPGASSGNFYNNQYAFVTDPQCAGIASSLQTICANNMHALALASDANVIIFQHAQPGVRGNYRLNQLQGPGRWSLDMTMGKNYEFMEGKNINIRVDAQNIFNHPTPSGGSPYSWNARFTQVYNPDVAIATQTNPFGYLGSKGGHRTFQAKIRLSF